MSCPFSKLFCSNCELIAFLSMMDSLDDRRRKFGLRGNLYGALFTMKVEIGVHNVVVTPVRGTGDGEALPKRWVAALVQMNCEKKVAAKLDKLGIENYVAVQQEIHLWSDRRKKIDRVVIPMIVFVRLSKNEEDAFRRLSFIQRFLTYPGSKELATPIPDEQIETLKFLLHHADAPVSVINQLKVGDKVCLVRGPLRGLEGELCYIEENKPIVAIRIEGLGYACVNVDKANLELYTAHD